MIRRLLLVALAGFAGLVVYLGWKPLKRQLKMWRMEQNPTSPAVE